MNNNLRSVFLLSGYRTGSNLVASIYTANNIGNPREYFNTMFRRSIFGLEYKNKIAAIENTVEENTINGIFSAKLPLEDFSEIFGILSKNKYSFDTLYKYFGNICFVRIKRLDVFAQSISLWLAKKTNQWVKLSGETTPNNQINPIYNFKEIFEQYAYLCKENSLWEEIIRKYNIEVFDLIYEEFIEDFSLIERSMESCSDYKEGTLSLETQHVKQGNKQNIEFRDRFIIDLMNSFAVRRGND